MKQKYFCIRVKTPNHIDPKEHLEEVISTGVDLATFKDSEISFEPGKYCAKK